MEKTIIDLFNDLGNLLFQISMKTKLSEELRESFEEGLKSLIDETLVIISQIEERYNEVEKFPIEDVNNAIRSLVDDISVFFRKEQKAKNTFNKTERKLYDSLTWNLHVLIDKTVSYKKEHTNSKLFTLDRASAKKGEMLLSETWSNILRDVNSWELGK